MDANATESLKPRVPACIRTGMCCETVLMAHSPRQLRDAYRAWRDGKTGSGEGQIIHLKDIDIVYPMLAGRCRGRWRGRYVFGPCKHLARDVVDGRDVASCSIHEDRPQLCREYPNYGKSQELRMGPGVDVLPSPGYMRGCGYNADPNAGNTSKDIDDAIVPLTDEEK